MNLVHVMHQKYDVYIGRKDARIGEKQNSLFYNPYKSQNKQKAWAVELFRIHARRSIVKGTYTRKDFSRKLFGKNVGCWCSGLCHGLVLKALCENLSIKDERRWIESSTYDHFIVKAEGEPTHPRQKEYKTFAKIHADRHRGKVICGVTANGNEHYLFKSCNCLLGSTWEAHDKYDPIIM